MNIQLKTEPFEHFIIENTFNAEQWYVITEELENIYNQNLFSDNTGSAINEYGKMLKKNSSVFLQELSNYKESNIYQSKYELWGNIKQWLENTEVNKKNWVLYNLKQNPDNLVRSIKTLVSYYEDSNRYDDHCDNASFTCLTWYYKEPKKFTGGELVFPDFDYSIPCKKNYTVIFPSFLSHKVNEVNVEEDGYGRFTLTNFWEPTNE